MYILRNLVFIFGFLIFAAGANASTSNSIKLPDQTPPVKVAAPESAATRVNINSADAITLQKIKGFGKKKAQAVISGFRNEVRQNIIEYKIFWSAYGSKIQTINFG